MKKNDIQKKAYSEKHPEQLIQSVKIEDLEVDEGFGLSKEVVACLKKEAEKGKRDSQSTSSK